MNRPAFQFYPADWIKDPGLRLCSLAARGMWVEMLCIAHESEPYGHLVVNGRAMTDTQVVAGIRGATAELLGELDHAGVFSRTAAGAIYSRRMVKDEHLRTTRAAGGPLGAEHGWKGGEHGIKGGRPRKNPPSPPPDGGLQKPPPSSSSSSSSSVSSKALAAGEKISPSAGGWDGISDRVLQVWHEAYPAVDLRAELARARAWVEANPANRKSNWPRFLVKWLTKSQDNAPAKRERVTGNTAADKRAATAAAMYAHRKDDDDGFIDSTAERVD